MKTVQQTALLRAATASLCIATSAVGCHAQNAKTAPSNWITDCVGRMQLSMPGQVEVAAYSASSLEKLFQPIVENGNFEFQDGQVAGYSGSSYNAPLRVTHSLSEAQIKTLLIQAKKGEARTRDFIMKKQKPPSSDAPRFEDLELVQRGGVAFRVNASYSLTVPVGSHLLYADVSYPGKDWSSVRGEFEVLAYGSALRAIGDVPRLPGICLPYVFIKDGGSARRYVSTTYRLMEHPDVTIMLRDSKAESISRDTNPDKVTPEAQIDFFWRQSYQDPKRMESIWQFLRPIKLANVSGKASLVQLTRSDDQIDYGYLAVAEGDPDAEEDTPNLMLYVIRDAKNAKAKGIEPLDKDEFIKLAQTIAASVKHRPTAE
ncbi:T6SS immunity protein Tli4 family protein [Variovorax sp. GB1P17]|uniref:T6SS immunity protein Tli4 family protein n=1 Tax=Variovorax sp. GB1P17 TaxID=3443740 RepID=UPI003F4598B3